MNKEKIEANNGERQPALSPATCSASWNDEWNFWVTKANRAYTRYEVAVSDGDREKAEIAEKQFYLYKRRADVIVPESVRKEWDAKKAADLKAALEE